MPLSHAQNFKKRLYLLFMIACASILLFSSVCYAVLDFYFYGDLYKQEGLLGIHISTFIAFSVGISVPILLIVHLIVSKVVNHIYDPLSDLMGIANKVCSTNDFSLRAIKHHDDEIGCLTDIFNQMVNKVQHLEDIHDHTLYQSQQTAKHYLTLFEQAEKVNRDLEKEANERNVAEQKLHSVRLHLNDIINSMPSALICVDEYGTITEWNNAAARLLGCSVEKVIGNNVHDVFPEFTELHNLIQVTLRSRLSNVLENITEINNNTDCFYNILAYPLTTEGVPGVVIRIDDITTQVRMQDMMVQTEKMMSVGGLAAGMAHEINNPLGAIMQSSQNIIRRLDANTPANRKVAEEVGLDWQALNAYLEQRKIVKFVENIIDAGNRAATIVKNMLQFSRKSDHKLVVTDLLQLVDRVIGLAANDYDLKKDYDFRKIKIIREYQNDMPTVPCIASEVEQVLLNLFRNAAQAMNEAKTLNQHLVIRIYSDQSMANIQVEDNGPGMPREVQKKIFEPFYTTKEVGVGTGLGLSVSYFIIKDKHSGDLTVESQLGSGTCFTIQIPLQAYQQHEQAS